MPTLWIVHRDASRRAVLARLAGAGEDTILGDPADRLFEGSPPADVVLLGLTGDFEEELEFAHRHAPRLGGARWMLVAERDDVAEARRLFDTLDAEVVAFPPTAESLRLRLRSALVHREVEPLSERRARDALAARFARWFGGLEIPELLRALDPRLARAPILIRGEPGSGRTLLAQYLHGFGGSTGGALVRVTCHPSLGAAEILASISAAAHGDRGRRSLCVVLEDVDRLAPAVQREVRGWVDLTAPPGIPHSAWVRWIGTVTETPEEPTPQLEPGLRQALAAIPIVLPPLRDSPERIVALAEDVARVFSETTGSRPRRLAPDALALLAQHPWPGNLRELEAVVTRSLASTSSEVVYASSLRFESEPLVPPSARPVDVEQPAPERRPHEPAPRAHEASAPISPELETWRLMAEPGTAPVAEAPAPVRERAAPRPVASRPAPAELVGDPALRQFLGAISHELGGSLMPLHEAAELVPEHFTDAEFRERFDRLVQTDPRRIEAVLGRLSRFASFPPPTRGEVDLSATFDSLVEEQRTDLEDRQILLLRELERSNAHVHGDAEQLHFALEALLRTALHLVKPRGDLYIASRFHPHGLRGAPSIRALIRFQSTARITPAPTAEGSSLSETALDLLLVEAIVRAHGGRFTLDTGEAAETVVLIDLPAPAASAGLAART